MLTNFSDFIPDQVITDQIDQPYFQLTDPQQLAVDVRDLKEHLRLPNGCSGIDSSLQLIICAVHNFAESYTGRVFIQNEFETFRDFFTPCIVLRKSPFIGIINFQYLVDGIFIDVPTDIFYVVRSNGFNRIERVPGKEWPKDIDHIKQSVRIEFTAGYGILTREVPCDIRMALLNHAARIYTDRGDCIDGNANEAAIACLPCNSKLLYNSYRIKQLSSRMGCW